MVTYSVGFGMKGTLSPDDYTEELKHKTTGDYIVWPNPSAGGSSSIEKIDDVWHAAVNARGKFLNASNPKELVQALQDIMMDIELRIYSAAGVSINGDKLYQKLDPDILMFQSSYSSDGWTGDVRAYKLDPVTGEVQTSSYEWSAAKLLTGVNWNTRLVASYNGTTGIPFRFNSLNSYQKSLLDTSWETDDTLAQKYMA
jgi:Tfp pilus tip-associated adhesin PilY1